MPGRRLLALVLLLAFGAGSGGFALLDAGLHHRDRATGHPAGAHLEQPGDPGCHAGRCVLGISHGMATLSAAARPAAAPAPVPGVASPPAAGSPVLRIHAAARPRAPPSHSA